MTPNDDPSPEGIAPRSAHVEHAPVTGRPQPLRDAVRRFNARIDPDCADDDDGALGVHRDSSAAADSG